MSIAGIKVLLIGQPLPLPNDYHVVHLDKINQLFGTIATFNPDIILTTNVNPGALAISQFELRKKWINVDPKGTIEDICRAIEGCYSFNIYHEHPNQKFNPLISVYTGTHNTGDFLTDTYNSLRDQTYKNWEWVVVDDFSTDGTWDKLVELAKIDIRVRPFRLGRPNGKIGGVKGTATRLCNGEYLVELDHDDTLPDTSLEMVKSAFESDPSIGMVYSNCANTFQDGSPHRFNDPFWKVRYKETEYHGKKIEECRQPNIMDRFGVHFSQNFSWYLTVGPNHVRAYRAEALKEIGGYNELMPVADDADAYMRMYLAGSGEDTVESTTIN